MPPADSTELEIKRYALAEIEKVRAAFEAELEKAGVRLAYLLDAIQSDISVCASRCSGGL